MKKATRKLTLVRGGDQAEQPPPLPPLGALIHDAVREAIEQAIEEELDAALGAARYARVPARAGYRNGTKARRVTTPVGPVELNLPRATRFTPEGGSKEWASRVLPRYQRRLPEVNEAIAGVYLAGVNTRRLRGALRPLLRGAPLSRSAVSRVVQTLKANLTAWQARPLGALGVVYLYLDAIALKVRSAGKVVSLPVLVAVAVLADGSKQMLALEAVGSESSEAWKGFVDGLVARGLRAPRLCIVDGNPGLRGALAAAWPKVPVQRCTVHKLRNLLRKAPQHAHAAITEDYHAIVYAESEDAARAAYERFVRKWSKQCPGVARSLEEAGEELLTFLSFPASQWRSLRSTNLIERLNEEFRRRVKTQSSLPDEDAALVLLFSLVSSGQIVLRRMDGWRDMVQVVADAERQAA